MMGHPLVAVLALLVTIPPIVLFLLWLNYRAWVQKVEADHAAVMYALREQLGEDWDIVERVARERG